MKSDGLDNEPEDRLSKLLFSKPEEFAERLKPEHHKSIEQKDRKAAWVDEDDEAFKDSAINKTKKKGLYKDTLKRKYETLIGTPKWARLGEKVKNKDRDVDDESILRSIGHVQAKKSVTLPKDYLETKGFPKLRIGGDKRTVSCLEFHPTATVALMGTHSGNVSLFSIEGDVNNKLHSFRLSKHILSSAHFTPDGNTCFISSAMKHKYCVYDLIKAQPEMVELPTCILKPKIFLLSPNGKYLAVSNGYQEIYLISAVSKELLREMKHNSIVHSMVFSHDSEKIYTYCEQGEVCIWDLSTYRVVKKFYDQGCVTASTITASSCGRLLATGSGEGIVNIYETEKLNTTEPAPLKVIQNLRSKITSLKFNPASEILSLSSTVVPDAVKLVQIPSYHVFANFPPPYFSMKNIETVRFSPNSGFMGIANNTGCVHLFRLKHYNNY